MTTADQDEARRIPRVLIVDDVADNRILLARRFTRRGYETVQADCGEAALAAIEREPFDIVLLDIMMPDLDGMTVLADIRKRRSPLELPVIMVTAKADTETVVEALRRQANDYITKPIIFDVALARVAAQIERKLASEKLLTTLAALRAANCELVLSNERLLHQTYHDPLTDLPNRRWLNERMSATLGEGASRPGAEGGFSALLLLDLDGFKSVNDTLGHSVGDGFLRELSRDLKACLQCGEDIVRLGGDEFAILAPRSASRADQEALAARLIEVASRERSVEGHDIALGASVGIAASARFATSEALLRAADIAMYEAKAMGRGTHCLFRPEMDETLKVRQTMLKDLRGALERGEFRLHYQPFVTAATHDVSGYEALLRWQHPEHGSISPAEFVPLAEESGLIVPIGAWVLREACQWAASLPSHQRVAVNVSPAQFRRPGFELTVVSALAAARVHPSRLEIEITEAMLIDDSVDTVSLIRSLKQVGVRLSLDDFGTGYSSLSYLRKYPFDKLKIDRSFVRDLTSRSDSEAIVRAICQMAEALAMTVTAEGVETAAQAESLLRFGCAELQGFLFGRPSAEIRRSNGACAAAG